MRIIIAPLVLHTKRLLNGNDDSSLCIKVHNYAAVISTKRAACSPGKNWSVALIHASDWTAINADLEVMDLFGRAGDNFNAAQVRSFIRSSTVADLTVAQRNAISAKYDSLGVDRTGITGSTSLLEVLRRALVSLHPSNNVDDF